MRSVRENRSGRAPEMYRLLGDRRQGSDLIGDIIFLMMRVFRQFSTLSSRLKYLSLHFFYEICICHCELPKFHSQCLLIHSIVWSPFYLLWVSSVWAGGEWLCTPAGPRTRRWCRQWPNTLLQLSLQPWEMFLQKSVLYSWAGPELTLGLFVCMVLWMLMSTRKIVTSRVIRPGIISGFTRKLEEDNVI